ncbi:MAG: hypothetical protein BZ137_09665 [Methanosphaera sp. rholeuAM130]|nr:MAG: hypothetical protein BZ137_09665 [Methanosphaera sp. rholeuAM130]
MTAFRKLEDDEDAIVAPWIYETDKFLFDKLFTDKCDAINAIGQLINSDYINPYHRSFITVIYTDNPEDILGISVSFKGCAISSEDTFNALMDTQKINVKRIILIRILDLLFSSYIRKNDYYIGILYVAEQYRKQGLGSKLVEKCKQMARQSNSYNILVDVEYSKEYLLDFYSGFEFDRSVDNYHKIVGKTYGCYGMKCKLK